MTLVDDDLQRLWSLVADLSAQLSSNKELCASLIQHVDELKGQALHTGTGYTLRRFNTDISKEQFESELERLNAQLVVENQTLQHENRQIALLLREYENTLETVMGKFRNHSHATQQHTLQLTSHYEALLASNTHNAASTSLHASTALSSTLSHLGGLVRQALRSIEGESDPEDSDVEDGMEGEAETEGAEDYRVGSPVSASGSGSGSGTGSASQSAAARRRSRAAHKARWAATGGYTGKAGDEEYQRTERALERLTEEERLRAENECLRMLLGLKEASDSLLPQNQPLQQIAPPAIAPATPESVPAASPAPASSSS